MALDGDAWIRRGAALVVAGVAAYASYVHQYTFARQGGADRASATLWPLSVDGLLLLATVSVLKVSRRTRRRVRSIAWLAFFLGIAVSLAANIAAASALAWGPVLVAGWPPVALLLAVELLVHTVADPSETAIGNRLPLGGVGEVDPLLSQACRVDARHRELHERPISAATLRRELRIGSERSRRLVRLIRSGRDRGPTD
ncbi:DUF2637 domain-containing protein [Streptomyces sp. NPDC059010]|uniref:DUF2637 domain-containing protein n=1 Tax=Streptomyces sp. NPDC059010 TaxID=3346695 RepID=UPI0036D095DB